MKVSIKKIITAYLVLCVLCVSCSKEKNQESVPSAAESTSTVVGIKEGGGLDLTDPKVKDAGSDKDDLKLPTQLWHFSDKRVCVLFGYGYNTKETAGVMAASLIRRYGSDENGGLILPLVYPDDFKHGKKDFAYELEARLEKHEICGIVLLGAPENTHYALARLQDDYDEYTPFPVFSFFPQDDVAGMESTADFVVDKAQEADLNGALKNESEQITEQAMPQILVNAVQYVMLPESELARDKTLFTHVQTILGKRKVSHYVDPETGLQSINHFILN
jgi:hypothetical protein